MLVVLVDSKKAILLLYSVQVSAIDLYFGLAYRNGYCKFGNFCENFIFANSVKTHLFDVEIRDKGVIYLLSINDRVISPIREDFIFTKFPENKTLAKISKFTVLITLSRNESAGEPAKIHRLTRAFAASMHNYGCRRRLELNFRTPALLFVCFNVN